MELWQDCGRAVVGLWWSCSGVEWGCSGAVVEL